ncbi:hypothetical protein Scel_60720 [Streptomyces cellostaticus]|nr:hypothetical protein Scel_60720 [Streptomyces cellostaticus]
MWGCETRPLTREGTPGPSEKPRSFGRSGQAPASDQIAALLPIAREQIKVATRRLSGRGLETLGPDPIEVKPTPH